MRSKTYDYDNPFDLILEKLDNIDTKISNVSNTVPHLQLSEYCQRTKISRKWALDVLKDAIRKPAGRMYIVNVDIANRIMESEKLST